MRQVQRLDVGRLDAAKRTPQGFLVAPAHLTRAGVLTYYNADGSERREWRSTAEVFKADSLASLVSAPVTDRHPPEMVTSENRSKYDQGNIGDQIVRDGSRVAATIYVKDGKLISSIERGDGEEVSCGYRCDLDPTPGVVPAGEPDAGQKYDATQQNISYNHVAILPKGRAGNARLHLDAADNVIFPVTEPTSLEKQMRTERIDGVDYEIGTDAHKAAVVRRDADEKKRTDALAKAEKDLADARTAAAADKARADAADDKVKKAEEALKLASDPARLDHAVKVRAAIVTRATAVLGKEFKADGLSNFEVKLQTATKAFPHLKMDAKQFKTAAEHRAYVNGLFRAAIAPTARVDGKQAPKLGVAIPEALRAHPDQLRADAGGTPQGQRGERTLEDVRRSRQDADSDRHRQPLMVSKNNPSKDIDGFPALQSSQLETMK